MYKAYNIYYKEVDLLIKIKLAEILKKKGKSIYWLAEETGITYPTLHKIATKETQSIKLDILEKIVIALDITFNEILEIEEE